MKQFHSGYIVLFHIYYNITLHFCSHSHSESSLDDSGLILPPLLPESELVLFVRSGRLEDP